MEHGGYCCRIVGVLSGSVCVGAFDWTETWGTSGWNSGAWTEEHGVCYLDGLYVFEPSDSVGWWVLFDMAQFGELLAVVEGKEG